MLRFRGQPAAIWETSQACDVSPCFLLEIKDQTFNKGVLTTMPAFKANINCNDGDYVLSAKNGTTSFYPY